MKRGGTRAGGSCFGRDGFKEEVKGRGTATTRRGCRHGRRRQGVPGASMGEFGVECGEGRLKPGSWIGSTKI